MRVDPIAVEVIRNALSYSAEEMGIALRNSAYSHNIKERMDHSCALFSPQGKLLAQAEHIPVHLGSLPWGVKNVLRHFRRRREEWRKDDIVMVNDPYVVGTHLSDVTLIKPVFFDGTLLGFSVDKAHHADVGGDTPGSLSSTATSLYQEGVVIHPVKLVRHAQIDDTVLEGLASQVRNPDITRGDLRAQIAAVNLGERRLMELADRYRTELLFASFREIVLHSRRRMRDMLKVVPEGIYAAEDCLEDVVEQDSLSWIRVTVTREKDRLNVDFSGTDKQVEAPFNAVFGVTLSATYFAVKSIVDPDAPMNEGTVTPVRVFAPRGTLVNPRRPAPVSGGNLETSQRIADVVFKALAKAVPDRVPAASHGSMNNVIVGGSDPERNRQWVFVETNGGGSGGRPGRNGVSGIHCNMTNTMNTPIEAIEQYYPVLFQDYELRPGTSGAGTWPGGCGIRRAWTLLGPSATVTILGDRNRIPPWGLNGGKPGGVGAYWVQRRGKRRNRLGSKVTLDIAEGDTIIIETPGGGGYGKPEGAK
ncbi:MAG: hydantoinase B/oxoprolinase family protein [Chloroflexota bacterium]